MPLIGFSIDFIHTSRSLVAVAQSTIDITEGCFVAHFRNKLKADVFLKSKVGGGDRKIFLDAIELTIPKKWRAGSKHLFLLNDVLQKKAYAIFTKFCKGRTRSNMWWNNLHNRWKAIYYWKTAFRCPCGYNSVINLNLLKAAETSMEIFSLRQITIYPSIWRKVGCGSHFHVRKGKIQWSFRDRKTCLTHVKSGRKPSSKLNRLTWHS